MIGPPITNTITISVRKCSCIVLGNIDIDNVHYSIGIQPVNIVSKVRDLGVIMDSAAKFNLHISYIVAKAGTCASLFHKCFVSHCILLAEINNAVDDGPLFFSPSMVDTSAAIH